MNTNTQLEKILYDNWLKVTTWHTGHPSDNKRFHLAIKKVYVEIGYITHEDILEGIKSNINSSVYNDEYIAYARKVSYILEYLNDTKV